MIVFDSYFLPLLESTNRIIPVDIALGDMGFDDESNHVGAKKIGLLQSFQPDMLMFQYTEPAGTAVFPNSN